MGSQTHAFTARFDPELYEELRSIANLRGDSMNRFVVDAVKARLRTSRRQLLERYREKVEKLKAYAERDPEFEDAIQAFAEAEAGAEGRDPAEGTVLISDSSKETESPAAEIDDRLDEILQGG